MSPLTLSALYFMIVSLNEAGALSPGKAGCQQVPRISLSLSPTALGYTHMLLLLAFSGVLDSMKVQQVLYPLNHLHSPHEKKVRVVSRS